MVRESETVQSEKQHLNKPQPPSPGKTPQQHGQQLIFALNCGIASPVIDALPHRAAQAPTGWSVATHWHLPDEERRSVNRTSGHRHRSESTKSACHSSETTSTAGKKEDASTGRVAEVPAQLQIQQLQPRVNDRVQINSRFSDLHRLLHQTAKPRPCRSEWTPASIAEVVQETTARRVQRRHSSRQQDREPPRPGK